MGDKKKRKFDLMLFSCIVITLGFTCLLLFFFTNSCGRLIESFRDFGISIFYYFKSLFGGDVSDINVTVIEKAKIPFFGFLEKGASAVPPVEIPDSAESASSGFSAYWDSFFLLSNFKGYWSLIADILYYVTYSVLIIIPVILIIWLIGKLIGKKHNNDVGRKSLFLLGWYSFKGKVWFPVKAYVKSLYGYVRKYKAWWISWFVILLVCYNGITIGLEFLAYYFYFVASFDFSSLWIQFYKLFVDLWIPIRYVPQFLWLVLIFYLINRRANRRGLALLRYRERYNRAFVNERGLVTIVYGVMGAGKTALITDMALSAECELRDKAFEVILESDMKFPDFPWSALEFELKRGFEHHELYDVWSVRRFVRKKYARFQKDPCPAKIFGYSYNQSLDRSDVEKRLYYNDGLKVVSVWQVIEDYSCAYLIYTRQSSLIVSNYSIRSDNLMSDCGNFPMWNTDFFNRDPRLMDSFSRHSHILDYDMLRLGKVMIDDNPNRFSYGFGVYVITEIDKERKNSPELSSVKRDSDDCNQKNDMFNTMLKMARHGVVIANREFVRFICDLQRPTSLGADARELGEVVYIKSVDPPMCVLPKSSPYWFASRFLAWLNRRFQGYYINRRYTRADDTLTSLAYKKFVSWFDHYCTRKFNEFSSQEMTLQVESGRLDDEIEERKYFRQARKLWSDRYVTDCLSGIFESRSMYNCIGIDDLEEYAGSLATSDELLKQHSHFQFEVYAYTDDILNSDGSDSELVDNLNIVVK